MTMEIRRERGKPKAKITGEEAGDIKESEILEVE